MRRPGGTLVGALGSGLLCALVACADGVFAPGAPFVRQAQLTIAATAAAAGGSAAAFDRADAVRVRVLRAAYPLLDSTLAFTAGGNETRIHIDLELDSSPQTVGIQVELSGGGLPLFEGAASATLKQNETTPVAITLTAVPAELRTAPVPTFTALGDTAYAHGAIVFATGDTIRALHPNWTSLTPWIVSAGPDSMLVARAEGQGQILATYGTFVQTVPVTVSVAAASVTLSPRDATLYIGAPPLQFSAVVRDRRGNVLEWPVIFSSRDTTVAHIDSHGLAWAGRIGTTTIVASAGTVRDSTTVTVPGGGPIVGGRSGAR
jgi:hypothetical protein